MKKIQIGLLSMLPFMAGSLFGGLTATQAVNMVINSTSSITTTASPPTLTVTLDDSGAGSATDASTTYRVVSNSGASGSLKITGAITSGGNMPSNTALTISLASSTKNASQGTQTLTTSPVDLVTKLPTLLSDSGAITYTFNVSNGWTIPAQTIVRTVTLTLTSSS